MLVQRAQGRPCRGGNEVGRIKIVESLREMLRSSPGDQLSRKRLAEFAGVTPALITYYFPSKDGLVKEAALPVMETHSKALHAILASEDEPVVLLRKAVRYLLRCYSEDAGIVWVYRALMKESGADIPDYMAKMSEDLESFMKTHKFESAEWPSRALLLQGALWGIVQFVAEAKMLDLMVDELDRNQGVAPIIDGFLGALQPQQLPQCRAL